MQFLPRLLSRRTTPRRQKICGNGLSLSLEASPWRKPLYRGQSDFEWPQVRTGLDPLHRLAFSFFFFFRPKTRPKPRRWINRLFRCRAALRFIAWLIFRHGFISLKIFATRVRHYSTNWSQETEEEIFFFNMAILRFEYWISISDSFTLSILLLWFIEARLIHRKNSSRRRKYLQRAEFNVHVAGNVRDFYRCVNNCVN